MAKARKRKVRKENSMVAVLGCVLSRSIGYSVWTNKYVMNLKDYCDHYVVNFYMSFLGVGRNSICLEFHST